jgi:Zn-dependent protease
VVQAPQTQEEANRCRLEDERGGLAAPLEGHFYSGIMSIERSFCSMELVDKTAFPFPYAQIMKILLYHLHHIIIMRRTGINYELAEISLRF